MGQKACSDWPRLRCRRVSRRPAPGVAAIILIGHLSTVFSIFLGLVDWRFTHDAMYGLRAEVHSGGSAEDQRNVRILDRVWDVVSSGDADLQCRCRRIRLEGGNASVPCQQANRVADLKACHRGGGKVCGAALHVPGDFDIGQPDVVGVRVLKGLRGIDSTGRGFPKARHRHIRRKIGGGRFVAPFPVDVE
jgi:hypothetical protein